MDKAPNVANSLKAPYSKFSNSRSITAIDEGSGTEEGPHTLALRIRGVPVLPTVEIGGI